MEFTKIERAAIETILSEPIEGMDILRMQFAASWVTKREYTGVGFYTTISVPLEGMDILRMQFAASWVTKREYTGVGFYTTISVPRSLPPVKETDELREQLFGGATGLVEDPRAVVSFHLWLGGGYLETLEGVSVVGGGWPDESKIEVVGSYYGFPDGASPN